MTAATDQDHFDAVLEAVNVALFETATAYSVDDLQRMDAEDGGRPDDYVEVTVSRRYGGNPRQSGTSGSRGWRITARFVSHRFADNARQMRTAVSSIEDARLSVAGRATTPVRFETADDIAPDDGWFSGLTTYTYALTTTPGSS